MSDWPGFAYTTLGAIAGAITSLFFRQWQDMSRAQAAFAIFVGFSFSFFVSPLLFRNIADKQIAGGIFYLMATGSNVLIPMAIKWLGNFIPGKGVE